MFFYLLSIITVFFFSFSVNEHILWHWAKGFHTLFHLILVLWDGCCYYLHYKGAQWGKVAFQEFLWSLPNKHQSWVLTSCLVYLTAGAVVLNPSSTLSFMLKWIRALHILQSMCDPLSFSSHHYKAIWIDILFIVKMNKSKHRGNKGLQFLIN